MLFANKATNSIKVKGNLFFILYQMIKNPIEFLRRIMYEHDNAIVKINLWFGYFFVIGKPEHIEHVFAKNKNNYWKGKIFNRFHLVLGDGLLLSEGEQWKKQKKILQPVFTASSLASYIPIFNDVIQTRLEQWRLAALAKRPVNLDIEMRHITLRAVLSTMLSRSLSNAESDKIASAIDVVFEKMPMRFFTFFLPEWVKAPGQRLMEKKLKELDHIIYDLIDKRRNSSEHFNDMLSHLLAEFNRDPENCSLKQIRDHVVTAIVGAYDSTATTLTWACCLLSQRPEIVKLLRKEINEVLGQRLPEFEDLKSLTYAKMIIDEVLRLYPPFWSYFRTAYKDDVIGGVKIPAGSSLLMCSYVNQRDASFWHNPDVFDPERFRPGQEKHIRYSYYPFGEAKRVCIGKNMALFEMILVLVAVFREFDVALPPGYQLLMRAKTSIGTKFPPLVTITLNNKRTDRVVNTVDHIKNRQTKQHQCPI